MTMTNHPNRSRARTYTFSADRTAWIEWDRYGSGVFIVARPQQQQLVAGPADVWSADGAATTLDTAARLGIALPRDLREIAQRNASAPDIADRRYAGDGF